MPDSAYLPIISPALQDWLAKCESLVEMHNNFQASGGHMQFNLDLLDPEKLPESLRSEAIAYGERSPKN
jgi:hypothetical protein